MQNHKPLNLSLHLEPLRFETTVEGQEYVLPLKPEQARRLGAALILLADELERRQAGMARQAQSGVVAGWQAPLSTVN